MFYKLGDPYTQPRVTGIIFPVQWSKTDDPWQPFHSGSVIVAGFIQSDGTLIYDDTDLEAKLQEMEDALIAADQSVITLPAELQQRLKKPDQTKRSKNP